MKRRLTATAIASLALVTGAATAQPPADGPHGPGRGPGPGGFGLLMFDANADGKVTKAEFDSAQRARFEKIDLNKDGFATPEEFQAARKVEMEEARAAHLKERFAELDKDKNGQLSQSEFSSREGVGSAGMGKGPGPRMAGMKGGPAHFYAGRGPHGRGGDGPEGRPPRDRKVDQAGDGPRRAGPMDANSDGKVSLSEFTAGGAQAFARADANKDGTITIAELQALHRNRS